MFHRVDKTIFGTPDSIRRPSRNILPVILLELTRGCERVFVYLKNTRSGILKIYSGLEKWNYGFFVPSQTIDGMQCNMSRGHMMNRESSMMVMIIVVSSLHL